LPRAAAGRNLYPALTEILVYTLKIQSGPKLVDVKLSLIKGMLKFKPASQFVDRSQWPRSLRRELSSPARTLGLWILIRLEAWISECIYFVFVLSCV
jgi:hypothetical protein